ncbi:MAG: TetR/AcrR family transcriptional regulator [Lachnospiraceae bacterium]|nr:TetR/AcrR family transcriptional regulator [Lachnospiraceae bacterium]
MRKGTKKRPVTVKDHIAAAFIRLLKKKDYHEITVVDIASEANVGRVSFYRNFREKDDVLRYYIERVTDEWLAGTDENYVTLTRDGIAPYIVWLFDHMAEHRVFIDILMKADKMLLLEEEFDRRFFARLGGRANAWEIVYKAGGVYKLFAYWAKNGYRETPREVAEKLTGILEK